MKNILLFHTGGTIGSSAQENARVMNEASAQESRAYLLDCFYDENPEYKDVKFTEGKFPSEKTTLSESMSLSKLSEIISHIRTFNFDDYAGIVVLHGTDTLAYTAALFSFVFADIKIPLFLVSGNRPPKDPLSNARDNFKSAVTLICDNIAPNVYVTYKNSDEENVKLFLGSLLMQSENFSEDFKSACQSKAFDVTKENKDTIFSKCQEYSDKRKSFSYIDIHLLDALSEQVLLITPYTGLDYSLYGEAIENGKYKGVVHGTYHSGTVSYLGLVKKSLSRKYRENGDYVNAEKYEKESDDESMLPQSVRYLSDICKKHSVPLFIAPSFLGSDQYETMNEVKENTCAELLNMTTPCAYAKLSVALSFNLTDKQLLEYMLNSVNNEFIM